MLHLVWWITDKEIKEAFEYLTHTEASIPNYILTSLDMTQMFFDESDEDIGGGITQDIHEFGEGYVPEHEDMIQKEIYLPEYLCDHRAGITIHTRDQIFIPVKLGFITDFGLRTILPEGTYLS